METKNFEKYMNLIDEKIIEKTLRDDVKRSILKLEDFATKENDEINISENKHIISNSIRTFLEIFLEHLLPEKDKFNKLDYEEVGYFNNFLSSDKINFLGKNGLDRNIKGALFSINEVGNQFSHYNTFNSKNFYDKTLVITTLYKIWLFLHWYFNLKLENSFKSERYYIYGQKLEEKAEKKLKQSFFHEPFKNVVVNDEKILNILFDDSIEFFIPIYQRNFSWTESEINDLFYDLNKRIYDENEHFFGSVTFIKSQIKRKGNKKITEIKIVDGQQRFTTLVLFLKALYLSYYSRYKISDKIDEKLNFFIDSSDLPIKKFDEDSSTQTFKFIWEMKSNFQMIDEKLIDDNVWKIFLYIYKKIKNFSIDELDDLYKGLEVLVVGINWVKKYNEFELFESINSKGLSLTNFDIFKNYLMSLLEDELEDTHSLEISDLFSRSISYKLNWIDKKNHEKITDRFLEKFSLYIGRNIKINRKRLFSQFKDLYANYLEQLYGKSENLILKEYGEIIFEFGKFLHAVLLTNSCEKEVWEKSSEFRKFYWCFYSLIDSPAYASLLIPYLISEKNFDFNENGTIIKAKNESEFIMILKLLESWKIRGEIVFSNENIALGLGDFLNKLIIKIEDNKNSSYYDILNQLISDQVGNLSFPSLSEFKYKLESSLINNSSALKIIFSKIINNDIKEFDELQIDNYNVYQIVNSDNKKRDEDWNKFTNNISLNEDEIFSRIGNFFYHPKTKALKNAKEENISFLISSIHENNFTINPSIQNKINNLLTKNINLKNFIKDRSKELAEEAVKIFNIEKEG